MNRILRGPDGRHWEEAFDRIVFDEEARQWVYGLTAAVQDPDTGRWAADSHGQRITVTGVPDRAGYTEVSADPLHEPCIAHLYRLVAEVTADFEQQTGAPHPRAAALAHALEDLAMRTEQLRRRPRNPPPRRGR
ncbi:MULTISPECIES: hypothetical protein [Streptomyces]|uniref:Uncharacterized protein n=2 Tax=Streptomyces rimosus subsp. rimosus TaxID=132474 RepID=L8EJC2_STRR1|nr:MULTISPECIES: hypothetical protein [Streptomyces]KOG67405.1 hypothetical protein ADK78_40830 [Kitasatospora aureofaciens]MYT46728.1 hypothetical protein [Streptomyces sp. SID5471]KEF08175.1 hypothetical protein DF17_07755 [Streptomyces rimosus]KOT45690.1 hypothetical protein ADK42_02750 [Streptomyces rimosus subsp. rimosus]KOT46966.1 hypothetical protein ADK84_02315 [Streptomyces sp. NRRL WC-3701]